MDPEGVILPSFGATAVSAFRNGNGQWTCHQRPVAPRMRANRNARCIRNARSHWPFPDRRLGDLRTDEIRSF
jgi:hypothetical protein